MESTKTDYIIVNVNTNEPLKYSKSTMSPTKQVTVFSSIKYINQWKIRLVDEKGLDDVLTDFLKNDNNWKIVKQTHSITTTVSDMKEKSSTYETIKKIKKMADDANLHLYNSYVNFAINNFEEHGFDTLIHVSPSSSWNIVFTHSVPQSTRPIFDELISYLKDNKFRYAKTENIIMFKDYGSVLGYLLTLSELDMKMITTLDLRNLND